MSYLSACGDSSEPEGPVVSGAGLRIHQGDQQTALAGSVLSVQPAVKVVDVHGEAQEGVAVSFYVGVGGGVVSPGKVKTGKDGIAKVKEWQLGEVGENTLIAAAGTIGSVTFEALALGPNGSGLVQNADFGANTGRWPHGSGPSGWTALLELPGTEAVVEESSEAESGNLLRFSQLGERFGETRIDQCVRLEGQARLHLFTVVKVDKPHNDLRIRLNSDLYGSEEDCQKDKAETRIGEQTRSDFKLGPAEELGKNQWRAFSTSIAYDPQSPAYARISLRARDRSDPGGDGKAAKLWIDRIELVEK